jgi:hypothetical protein
MEYYTADNIIEYAKDNMRILPYIKNDQIKVDKAENDIMINDTEFMDTRCISCTNVLALALGYKPFGLSKLEDELYDNKILEPILSLDPGYYFCDVSIKADLENGNGHRFVFYVDPDTEFVWVFQSYYYEYTPTHITIDMNKFLDILNGITNSNELICLDKNLTYDEIYIVRATSEMSVERGYSQCREIFDKAKNYIGLDDIRTLFL